MSALIAIELVLIAGLCIDDSKAESNMDVSLREVEPQTVLYTVHRGHYTGVGPAINRLYQLAIAKGLHPCGSPSNFPVNRKKHGKLVSSLVLKRKTDRRH